MGIFAHIYGFLQKIYFALLKIYTSVKASDSEVTFKAGRSNKFFKKINIISKI